MGNLKKKRAFRARFLILMIHLDAKTPFFLIHAGQRAAMAVHLYILMNLTLW